MQRIHLSAAGVRKVHMMATLGPLAETIFAVDHLGPDSTQPFAQWRKLVWSSTFQSQDVTARMAASLRPHDLLWLLHQNLDQIPRTRLLRAGLRQKDVVAAVDQLCNSFVIPYWQQILEVLKAERSALVYANPAPEQLLSRLNADLTWNGSYLQIPGPDTDIHLGDTGLLIAPSLFLGRPSAVFLREVAGTGGQPVLVLRLGAQQAACADIWKDAPQPGSMVVEALLGRTRARLLRLTMVGGTTSELAEQIGTSAASVSQHTGILRKAGLIESNRDRNTVTHRITRLGHAVLTGMAESLPGAR